MTHKDPQLRLFLQNGDDPEKAMAKFLKFVEEDTGGDGENTQKDRVFFEAWQRSLSPDEVGVVFTRSEHGTGGVMTAYAVKKNKELNP